MGIDREYTSTMSLIAREVSTLRLSLLPKQINYPIKHDFTLTSPLHNSTYRLSPNHGNQTTLQPTISNCSRRGELRKESSTRLSFLNALSAKTVSTKNDDELEEEITRGSPSPTLFLTK